MSTSQHTRTESGHSSIVITFPPTSTSSSTISTTAFSTEDTRFKKRIRYNSNDSENESSVARASGEMKNPANDDETATMEVESCIAQSWKRDDCYYFEDGSCVFLVQDTLFNVHRSMLSRDGSSFGTMFTLPQGNTEAEGKSDHNPIILHGDAVLEFKHFLWALYALPPELSSLTSPTSDSLVQLMDIARISNKYSFKTLETWSLDAIQEYVNRKPSPLLTTLPSYGFDAAGGFNATNNSSPSGTSNPALTADLQNTTQLTQLIRLAQLCHHERLMNTMISLLRQLMSTSLQYAYLAMTISDELNLRSLRGAAYLEVMQKAVVVKKSSAVSRILTQHATAGAGATVNGSGGNDANATGSVPPTLGPVIIPSLIAMTTTPTLQPLQPPQPPDQQVQAQDSDPDSDPPTPTLTITPAQQLRLLSGYYRLTFIWESLRTNPPRFDHAPSCGATWHQHGCTQSWLEFWKEKTRGDAVLGFGLADVLGRLRQIQKDYDRWGSATYMHHDCRMAARKSIQETIKAVEDSLPDCFSEGEDE